MAGKRRSSEEVAAEKKAKEAEKTKSMIDTIYGQLQEFVEREDEFFPSGSIIIDSVLSNGKGIPMGKFISLTAAEGVGKSSMCLHIARNCCAKGYRALYIDTEFGLNRSQLESFAMIPFVENKTFIPKVLHTYRELDDLFASVVKDPDLKFIFLDSLTDVTPDQILTNNIADVSQPGLDARAQSSFLRKYKPSIAEAGITVFFLLQQRTKIGMTYGERTCDQGAGGHAVKHSMDIALELTRKSFITKTVKGHNDPTPYAAECYLKAIKNRYANPFIPMQLQILFGKGVSNSGAIANALILHGLVKTPTKTKYVVDFKGEEVTLISKLKFEEFVKQNLDYYKQVVESKGGIRLIPESDVPSMEAESEEDESSIEEIDTEDTFEEEEQDAFDQEVE